MLSSRFQAIERCAPDYQGRARIILSIGTDGHVGSASLTLLSDVISDFEKTCIINQLSMLTLPAPAHATSITYPLLFTRGKNVHRGAP